jgi:hypothetical protein
VLLTATPAENSLLGHDKAGQRLFSKDRANSGYCSFPDRSLVKRRNAPDHASGGGSGTPGE